MNAIDVVRNLAGPTFGADAAPGTIRGDFALSKQCNVIHTSDSAENAEAEIKRFFDEKELFEYEKVDLEMIYADDERS